MGKMKEIFMELLEQGITEIEDEQSILENYLNEQEYKKTIKEE